MSLNADFLGLKMKSGKVVLTNGGIIIVLPTSLTGHLCPCRLKGALLLQEAYNKYYHANIYKHVGKIEHRKLKPVVIIDIVDNAAVNKSIIYV